MGSHWRQVSSTGPAAPAARATTHQGGDVVGKRLQLRLLSDALTGESRNGEAGEGHGSEPREPGGLCHQAGGVSRRAPHQDPVRGISPGPTRWPLGAKRRLVPAKSNFQSRTFPVSLAGQISALTRIFRCLFSVFVRGSAFSFAYFLVLLALCPLYCMWLRLFTFSFPLPHGPTRQQLKGMGRYVCGDLARRTCNLCSVLRATVLWRCNRSWL